MRFDRLAARIPARRPGSDDDDVADRHRRRGAGGIGQRPALTIEATETDLPARRVVGAVLPGSAVFAIGRVGCRRAAGENAVAGFAGGGTEVALGAIGSAVRPEATAMDARDRAIHTLVDGDRSRLAVDELEPAMACDAIDPGEVRRRSDARAEAVDALLTQLPHPGLDGAVRDDDVQRRSREKPDLRRYPIVDRQRIAQSGGTGRTELGDRSPLGIVQGKRDGSERVVGHGDQTVVAGPQGLDAENQERRGHFTDAAHAVAGIDGTIGVQA